MFSYKAKGMNALAEIKAEIKTSKRLCVRKFVSMM